MTPDAFIDLVASEMRAAPSAKALFLSGSYGSGLQDAYSDIDFLAVVEEDEREAFAAAWRGALEKAGAVVMWRANGPLINAVMADWLRVDVLALPPERFGGRTKDGLKVLFDEGGLFDSLPDGPGETGPNAARLAWQFEEFIRIFGLLAVAMGRHEYLNGVTGLFHLRNLLVDLLIEETGAPGRGGALHLNRLITDEQKDLLASLPVPEPERDALIEAHLAYAAAYLPRARRMAARLGIAWPEQFEAATWQRLRDELGISPPEPITDG